MELDEMKAIWSDLSDQVEEKHQLTRQQILDMMEQKYRRQVNAILIPELIGSVICFGFSAYIFFNIQKLDEPLSLITGVLSAIIMIILPILSLSILSGWVNRINITENTYQKTLQDFNRLKRLFAKIHRYAYVLGFGMMFLVIPPLAKIMSDKNILEDAGVWFRLPFGIAFVLLFIFFTMRFYRARIRNIDQALQDDEYVQ
ncbi:MAG: hypothetical protein KTR30_00170 [Saprospiraceae bacterium]|nr:hypothetical protein [Saprospiraceae bacterium]